jgi:hypothetical protein
VIYCFQIHLAPLHIVYVFGVFFIIPAVCYGIAVAATQ